MTNITETTTSRIHVGLDVHKDTVVVAALTHEYGGALHFVYEAGPCGFVMWRQLREMGHTCAVVAPSLIPKKSGDRVKTDRRDARELAQLSLLGYLTPIRVPSETWEAMRDRVRLRLDMKQMIQRQRQQLNHFLLRHGHAWSLTEWTKRHRDWMKDRSFAEPAQQLTLMTSLASLTDQERRLATLDHMICLRTPPRGNGARWWIPCGPCGASPIQCWLPGIQRGFPAGLAGPRLPDRDHGAGGNRRSASVPQPGAIHGLPRPGAE